MPLDWQGPQSYVSRSILAPWSVSPGVSSPDTAVWVPSGWVPDGWVSAEPAGEGAMGVSNAWQHVGLHTHERVILW